MPCGFHAALLLPLCTAAVVSARDALAPAPPSVASAAARGTPGQLRSGSGDAPSVNATAVGAAVIVLVLGVAMIAAISGCVSKPERHEVYEGRAPAAGTHRQGSAGSATAAESSAKTKQPAQKPVQKSTGAASVAERVRKLPNKKQAFKHPVTRLDAEDEAGEVNTGDSGGNASAATKSTEQVQKTPSAKAKAASTVDDDSPLTLSAGTRRRRSVTRVRSGSSPALSKATASAAASAQTFKSPSSASRSTSGVRRLRSATATARPSARPALIGSSEGGDKPVVARKMRSKSVAAPSKKQMLLQWCRARIEPHAQALDVKPNFPRNFSKAWKSGKALIGILYDVDPSTVPLARVLAMTPAERLEFGFALAENRYGVARVLDVEDLTDFPKPDDKCVMLYASMLHKGVSRM